MKRYILYSAAVLLLVLTTSCKRDRGVVGDEPDANRILVNVTLDGVKPAATKAQITDIDLDARGFTIAGYYTKATYKDGAIIAAGNFGSQLQTVVPNIFDLEDNPLGGFYPSVRDLKKDNTDKYHVLLSKWVLSDDSYLSYVAWSTTTDVPVGGVGNPITEATGVGSVGQPYLKVTADGKTDIVAASSIDNRNDVVRGAIDLDFKHIFAKLRFQALATSNEITIKSAKLHNTAAVWGAARYAFNPNNIGDPGAWDTPTSQVAATYDMELGGDLVAAPLDTVFMDERLVIPQKVAYGDFYVEITYEMVNAGIGTSSYTRIVKIPARTLLQNTSYTYTLKLAEGPVEIGECNIGQWTIISNSILPQVVGPRGDVLLLLDASEPPYVMPDGKKYWLDHSGYNNHAEMIGNVAYDAAARCYTFADNDVTTIQNGFSIPYLGDYTDGAITVDVIAKTWLLTKNQMFTFMSGDLRQFFTHFYSDYGSTIFDAGAIAGQGSGIGARVSFTNIPDFNNVMAFYSYTYDAGATKFQQIIRNTTRQAVADPDPKYNSLKMSQGQIGFKFTGSMSYFRVTKKAKRTVDQNELIALSKKFKFSDDSYVEDGLLLNMAGTAPPSKMGGQMAWLDSSPNENHAFYNGDAAVSGITYDATNKCYTFTGKGYMQFIKSIGNNTNNMTLEVVLKSQNSSGGLGGGCVVQFNTLLDDASGTATAYQNRGGIYWPNASSVLLEAAHTENAGSGSSGRRFNEPHSDLLNQYGINVASKASISFVRNGNSLSFRHNGKESGLGTRTNPEALPKWTVGRIGGQSYNTNANYTGTIYAIRLYNRVLTDEERKANYELDKKLYNLP